MVFNEFDLIKHYFAKPSIKHAPIQRKDVLLGIGDDCALLQMPANKLLAVSMDTLVAGVHFTDQIPPHAIGHRALAVSLSDLAAMGAEPAWVTLALTLPTIDHDWLQNFSKGFFALLSRYSMNLVGGNLTRGPLSISVQVHGFVSKSTNPPSYQALRRDAAKPGDLVYVTGVLGEGALAVQLLCAEYTMKLSSEETKEAMQHFYYPQPRIDEGISLSGIANAAIDISDGFAADLAHILDASGVGASIYLRDLPVTPLLTKNYPQKKAWEIALSGGDDYELCFTVPRQFQVKLEEIASKWQCPFHCVGIIEEENGLRIYQPDGSLLSLGKKGYQHF